MSLNLDESEFASDLEPNTAYTARMQSKKGEFYSENTAEVTFTTPAIVPVVCGDNAPAAPTNTIPKTDLRIGNLIEITGFDVLVDSLSGGGGNGYYSGSGYTVVPFMAYKPFKVLFEGLFINELSQAGEGKAWFKTKPMEEWILAQIATQAQRDTIRKHQAQNEVTFADTEFYPDVLSFEKPDEDIQSISVSSTGEVSVTLANGAIFTIDPSQVPKPPRTKSFIIEDKNGDQWVVAPDGTVTLAPDGGLPADYMLLSKNVADITKIAFGGLVIVQQTAQPAIETEYNRVKPFAKYASPVAVTPVPAVPITPAPVIDDIAIMSDIVMIGEGVSTNVGVVKSMEVTNGEVNYYAMKNILHMNTLYSKINHYKYIAQHSFTIKSSNNRLTQQTVAEYIDAEVAKLNLALGTEPNTAQKNTIANIVKDYLGVNIKYYITKIIRK